MKSLSIVLLALLIRISCFAQEIEIINSLNTSSEQRFQNAYGIGLQYQNDLSQRFRIGFGVHYNINKSNFDHIPYIDSDPFLVVAEDIHASSERFSFRLNIQGLLKNNEHVSLSLGPEISYNYLWGEDHIDRKIGQTSDHYTQDNGLTKDFGFGLISKIEIKDFCTEKLSLCFTIRPELLVGKNTMIIGSESPVFSGTLGFTEFQIGLKYSFKK